MGIATIKQKAAFVSICSNSLLIILKLTVGFLTGSLSIISEALHSLSDIVASFIAFFSVKKSSEPADKDHPFGHGKFEELSGFFEGLLIVVVALFIFYGVYDKLLNGVTMHIDTLWGIVVMSISIVVNVWISKYLFYIGTRSNSPAIVADAAHLKTDVISSLAVLGGLFAIKITGLNEIDTFVAFIAGIIILYTGIKVVINSSKGLLDETLPQEDLDILQNIFDEHLKKDISEIKFLKSRKSGSEKLISLVITVDENLTIKEGHDICNNIENEIMGKLPGAIVMIHLEPCNCILIG